MKTFLKILSRVFLILLMLVFFILAAGIIFLKTFDIKKYKPQIIRIASQSLNRPVDFKDIDLKLSLEKGIRFHLTDLSIAEDPKFGGGHFAAIKEIDAGVDILSFLVSHRISVPSILILSPRIEIIRNPDGKFNVQEVGQTPAGLTQQGTSPSPMFALPAIFINSLKIENAELHLTDQTVQPEMKAAVTQFRIEVQGFSLKNSFDVFLEAAVLAPQINFHADGKIQLKLLNREAKFTETKISLDLSQLPLKELRASSLFKDIPLPESLGGNLTAKIKEAVVSEKGISQLNADVFLENGMVIAPDIAPGISLEADQVNLGVENFNLGSSVPAKIVFQAALYQDKRNMDFSGRISLDPRTNEVHLTGGELQTDLSLLPLKKITASLAPLKDLPVPAHLSGKLQASIKEAVMSPAGLKDILLDLKLENAEADLNNMIPGLPLAFQKTDVTVGNFSLVQPFFISFKTAYLSKNPNVAFDGTVSLDVKSQTAEIKDGTAAVDFDGFPLERLRKSGLIPAGIPFPDVLGGQVKALVKDLSVSSKGLGRLKTDIQWQNGKIEIPNAAPGISVAADQIDFQVHDFSLDQPFGITASLAYENDKPNIFFDGKASLDLTGPNIGVSQAMIKTDLSQISLDRLKTTLAPLKDVPLPQILKGQLAVQVKDLSLGAKGLKSVTADVDLNDGEIQMKDVAPGISFAASKIKAGIKDFSLGKPFGFDIRLAYLSGEPDIEARGTAAFSFDNQSAALKDTAVRIDLSLLSMEELKKTIASLKDVSLPEEIKGDLNLTIGNAQAGPKGLAALSCQGSIKDWMVKLKELPVPVGGQEANFKLTENLFTLDPLSASLGQGQVLVQAGVRDYLTRRDFDLSAEIKGLNLVEILNQKQASLKVEGLVFGSVKAKGLAADVNSITGNGNFEVQQARLKDLNVLKTVLDKISFLPQVSSTLEADLPEKYQEKLNSKDTEIKTMTGTWTVSEGLVVINPISIEADEFLFSGQSQAGFDQEYSLDGEFKIPEDLSALMTQSIQQFEYLFDAENSITLSVHGTGRGAQKPNIDVLQTALDVGKNAIRNEGKNQLQKVLNGVLGIPEQQPIPSPGQAPSSPSQEQKSSGTEIIDGIFDEIFK